MENGPISWPFLVLVRKGGFEPPRYCYRQPLKLVRLPVPPLPRGSTSSFELSFCLLPSAFLLLPSYFDPVDPVAPLGAVVEPDAPGAPAGVDGVVGVGVAGTDAAGAGAGAGPGVPLMIDPELPC
jgi:hypothetical protein